MKDSIPINAEWTCMAKYCKNVSEETTTGVLRRTWPEARDVYDCGEVHV